MFSCTKLLRDDTLYFPSAKAYGNVEIRPSRLDLPGERLALERSAEAHQISLNLDHLLRITTFVDAERQSEMVNQADLKFEETLDCLSLEPIFVVPPVLSDVGFTMSLGTGRIDIIPPAGAHPQGMTAQIMSEPFLQVDMPQMILAGARHEASERLLRAAHWYRLSRNEPNRLLRVLFRWFALETLCKVENGNDVIPRIMLCMGFFMGKSGQQYLSRAVSLEKLGGYKMYKKRVNNDLDAVKRLRNSAVHEGARTHEVAPVELKRYEHLTFLAFNAVKGRFTGALYRGATRPVEVWDAMPHAVGNDPTLFGQVRNLLYFLGKESTGVTE